MMECAKNEALDTDLCFRARLVEIDGTLVYDRCFYADVSKMHWDQLIERRNGDRNKDDVEGPLSFRLTIISDSVKAAIERKFGRDGFYAPFSSGYCKNKFHGKGTEIGGAYGIRIVEISLEDYEAIRY